MFSIDDYIHKAAPSDSDHDRAYAAALRTAYAAFQNFTPSELQSALCLARRAAGGAMTHTMVARCIVLDHLLRDRERK